MTRRPATLLLARHGQTVWHAENRYAGVSDIALTDEGRRQARQLGEWAARSGVDAIWTSTVSRAIETARPACEALGITPGANTSCANATSARWRGAPWRSSRPSSRSGPGSTAPTRWPTPFPGPRTPGSRRPGGPAALRRIADGHPGQRVLVVAHNTLLRLVLCELLSIPLGSYRRVFPQLRNTAVSEVRIGEQGGALLSLNVPCVPGVSP